MTTSSLSTQTWGTRLITNYEKDRLIGEGTYGQVWEGRNRLSGERVAIKKTRSNKPGYGMPLQALREIKILNSYSHTNMVHMVEMATSAKIAASGFESSLYIIFEYLEYDLSGLIDVKYKFSLDEKLCFMKQLLSVLDFLHRNQICHRDIKPSNLLINKKHLMKLTDFGLARTLDHEKDNSSQRRSYTNKVVTLYYRPPELLLGETSYGFEIDLWSAGCIFVEMFLGRTLFNGANPLEQMKCIFKLLGTPNRFCWPELVDLPGYTSAVEDLECGGFDKLDHLLKGSGAPDVVLPFARRLLEINPKQRYSSSEALNLTIIKNAKHASELPEISISEISLHEYEVKKRIAEGDIDLERIKHQSYLNNGNAESEDIYKAQNYGSNNQGRSREQEGKDRATGSAIVKYRNDGYHKRPTSNGADSYSRRHRNQLAYKDKSVASRRSERNRDRRSRSWSRRRRRSYSRDIQEPRKQKYRRDRRDMRRSRSRGYRSRSRSRGRSYERPSRRGRYSQRERRSKNRRPGRRRSRSR